MNRTNVAFCAKKAKKIIAEKYTWDKIVAQYEELFLNES